MSSIRLLNEAELRRIITLDPDTVDRVESAFRALASGKVVMPPVLSLAVPEYNGEVDVKTAYVPGFASFAIKISPGFFDNPGIGLPSTSGLMVLFSARTGMVEALLLDNGYLTDLRTAAAGAVAARHLARADAARACIVGAGCQARYQLRALCLVRPIETAVIWGRDGARAAAAARELSAELGISVSAAEALGDAVAGADIVVTATPAAQPLLAAEWLRPGQHITAMGSDQAHKNELHPECLARAELYVPDRQAQTERLGELRAAIAAGVVSAQTRFIELGDIVSGRAQGRRAVQEITICDLTGTGVQDTAIATLASERAAAAGVGSDYIG